MDVSGVARWPAAQIELIFQILAFLALVWMGRQERFRDRLFFVYLCGYGVFRFGHEFVRNTPAMFGGISGYQIVALAAAILGAWKFVQRGAGVQNGVEGETA